MLIFNCSQAATDFFTRVQKGKKITPVQIPPSARIEDDALSMAEHGVDPAEADQWLLHAAVIKRKHVLIATHIATRYMMFFSDMKKADVQGFLDDFFKRWWDGMLKLAMHSNVLDWVEMPIAGDRFIAFTEHHLMFKRGDRSTQGHLNEALLIFKDIVDEAGCLPSDEFEFVGFDADMNKMIRGIKGKYFYPEEEMLAWWLQMFCGVTDAGVVKLKDRRAAMRRSERMDVQ